MFTKNPVVEEFDYKYVRFFFPFKIYSKILGGWIFIPQKFICDRESVPIIKGTSIRGGYAHDLLSRKDAYLYIEMDFGFEIPEITKKLAADVYLEIMESRGSSWIRRYFKYSWVRVWPRYFQKLNVLASLKEIKGET